MKFSSPSHPESLSMVQAQKLAFFEYFQPRVGCIFPKHQPKGTAFKKYLRQKGGPGYHRFIYWFRYNCHHICHLFSVLLSYPFLLLSTYALCLHKFCLALAGSTQGWSLLTPVNDNSKIYVAIPSLPLTLCQALC